MKTKLIRQNFKEFIKVIDGQKVYKIYEHTNDAMKEGMYQNEYTLTSKVTELTKKQKYSYNYNQNPTEGKNSSFSEGEISRGDLSRGSSTIQQSPGYRPIMKFKKLSPPFP